MKRFIPKALKVQYQLTRRCIKDYNGDLIFAKKSNHTPLFNYYTQEEQKITQSACFDNKATNIQTGAAQFEQYIIQPNEVLSFWKVVGAPTPQNGFKKSRNLVQGVLQQGYGGGLCLLASLIYYQAIKAGLEIVERHHHSYDVYNDYNRCAPLGSDAAVAYGYLDLRIKNNTNAPIYFKVWVDGDKTISQLYSTLPLPTHNIEFKRNRLAKDKMNITTICNSTQFLHTKTYQLQAKHFDKYIQ